MKQTHQNKNKHVSVLLKEVLELLEPKVGDSYLDLTAGYGGHAEVVLERTLKPELAFLVDRDEEAASYLSNKFKKANIINKDFLSATKELREQGLKFDLILADLGVSSPHLNEARRGFSLKKSGPLDMRMGQYQDLKAENVVNEYSEAELAKLIKSYGEEPRANKIARLIVENRPITDTTKLAIIIKQAWPRFSKIHPATRTFQAIRIAVNDELNQIEQSLPIWIELLKPGGRIAVISFHSLEDRIIKDTFRELGGNRYDSALQILTKSPLQASKTELASNPRARSAKLRAAVKIKIKGRGKT